MFSSSHFLISKETFKNLNGFNEELNSYEDCEFYHRCLHEKVNGFFDKIFRCSSKETYFIIIIKRLLHQSE